MRKRIACGAMVAATFFFECLAADQAWSCGRFDVRCKARRVVEGAARQVVPEPIRKLEDDVGRLDEKAKSDVANAAQKAMEDAAVAAKKSVDDTIAFNKKAAKDTFNTYVKAGKDVYDAAKVAGKFVENEIKGHKANLSDANRRIREGKLIDAFWHAGTTPAKNAEQNAAKATQDSEIINAAAQGAATFYGGPAGAAAYAAWYTYRASGGDVNLALRAGIITGVTSYAGGTASKMPTSSVSEVAKKAIVTGALGGAAVAASGGDDAAVREAFLKQGGMVIVQAGQDYARENYVRPAAAKLEAYCMSVTGEDCRKHIETGKQIAKDIKSARGKADALREAARNKDVPSLLDDTELGGWTEPSGADGSKLENYSAYLSDADFVLSWSQEAFKSKKVNVPAVVVTFEGAQSPLAIAMTQINAESAQHRSAGCKGGGSFMYDVEFDPSREYPELEGAASSPGLPIEIMMSSYLDTPLFFGEARPKQRISFCNNEIEVDREVKLLKSGAFNLIYERSVDVNKIEKIKRYWKFGKDDREFSDLACGRGGEDEFLSEILNQLVSGSTGVGKVVFFSDKQDVMRHVQIQNFVFSYSKRIRDTGRRSSRGRKIHECSERLVVENLDVSAK